jgi:hypothetical protein
VGLFVGAAVRKGSGGRGGWRYQALAILLTYASIVSTYIPYVVSGLNQVAEKDSEPAAATATSEPAVATTADPAAAPAEGQEPAVGSGGILIALLLYAAFVLAIAFAAPFLGGVENIMGIVIIGIALYEAWKINRAAPLEITGPHRVGSKPSPPAPTGGPGLG